LSIGQAFVDALDVHIAVTHGLAPTLYIEAHFTAEKADLLPAIAANWLWSWLASPVT
jgi:hypothetical protein